MIKCSERKNTSTYLGTGEELTTFCGSRIKRLLMVLRQYNTSLPSSLRMDTSGVTLSFIGMISSLDAVTLRPLCGQWKKTDNSRDTKISI